jgi:branched-chain amino acid transport system permease protein
MTQLVLLATLDGIANASSIFIVSVGLTFVFGVLRILNVAHGSLYAVGAYVGVSLGGLALALGPIWALVGLLVAPLLVGGVLGPLIERAALRPIYDKEPYLQLLMTFGLFMMAENLQRLVFGVQPRFFDPPLQALGTIDLMGITYTRYQVILLPLAALAVLASLHVLLDRMRAGRIIVAIIEDREVAVTLGVDARRIYALAFSFGAGLAALGGALAAPTTSIAPGLGANVMVLSFAVVASAGLG